MSGNATAGLSGLWWTGTPKGLNGTTPPGIGLSMVRELYKLLPQPMSL
jgi:hypothetical protein